MASTVFQPIANQLVTILRGLTVDGHALTVPDSGWTRGNISPPGAEIELPDGNRTQPEGAESQLGSNDYDLDFPVTIWVDLTEPTVSQQRLAEYLEKFIAAVDADRGLGGTVLDATVSEFEVVYGTGTQRSLVGYETTVSVIKLV